MHDECLLYTSANGANAIINCETKIECIIIIVIIIIGRLPNNGD